MDSLIKLYNKIYIEKGYHGIIRALKRDLEFGDINFPSDNLLQVTTGGWIDDEDVLSSLTSFNSMFGYNHYVGKLRGGVFYFAEQMESTSAFEIIKKLPDIETCNPKICRWCKYSSNGKRNPARSITLCDGCRYNEEFEHI